MNSNKVSIHEIDRNQFINRLDESLKNDFFIDRLKKAFADQLEFLCGSAGIYYSSYKGLKPELLRPYLIALVDGEQTLEDRFGLDLQLQIQAVYDIAFLRELMVLIKNQTINPDKAEKQQLIQSSSMKMFREKLNSQEAWLALLKVMQ